MNEYMLHMNMICSLILNSYISNRQILRKTKVVGNGHVRKHSQPTGDHPHTDTLFLHIAWKFKPSQPIGNHSLWPCPSWVVSNCVRRSYVILYIHIHIYIPYIHTHV